jgi:hypothetical protein
MTAGGRPLALVLLGVWLGALVASWVMATVNFRTVDRVLGPESSLELQAKLTPVAADDRRMVLRHLASEINRWMFRWWAPAQLIIGAGLLALAWPSGGARWLFVGALALTLAQALALTPNVVEIGRAADFIPRPLPPDLAKRFGVLHAAYVVSDLVKAALIAAGGWLLIRRPGP